MNSSEKIKDNLNIPEGSSLSREEYFRFLEQSCNLLRRQKQYLCGSEGMGSLELPHLLVKVPETVLTIYIGMAMI